MLTDNLNNAIKDIDDDVLVIDLKKDTKGNKEKLNKKFQYFNDLFLLGRKNEINLLDTYLKSEDTKLITMIGESGIGKTAIIKEWIKRIIINKNKHVEKIIFWSLADINLYSEEFYIEKLLYQTVKRLDSVDTEYKSIYHVLESLLCLFKDNRILFIIDEIDNCNLRKCSSKGMVTNILIQLLLQSITNRCNSVYVTTSRISYINKENYIGKNQVKEIIINNISHEDKINLLNTICANNIDGIFGKNITLEKFNPLLIKMLGEYIKLSSKDNLLYIQRVNNTREAIREPFRFITELLLPELQKSMEYNLLNIAVLLGRPFIINDIYSFIKHPIIKEINNNLKPFRKVNREIIKDRLSNLVSCHFLVTNDTIYSIINQDILTLLLENFKIKNEKSWTEGNKRLYKFYKSSSKKHPKTLKEMKPLYNAITHACNARKYQESFDILFYNKIRRKTLGFNINVLGDINNDLNCLSNFFFTRWSEPIRDLHDVDKAYLFNAVGYDLWGQLQLADAAFTIEKSLALAKEINNLLYMSVASGNLSLLYLSLGDTEKAEANAKNNIEYRYSLGNLHDLSVAYSNLAYIKHQKGEWEKAEILYDKSIDLIPNEDQKDMLVNSYQYYVYCSFLIDNGSYDAARRYGINLLNCQNYLVDNGRAHLILAKAELKKDQLCNNGVSIIKKQVDKAINFFHLSGRNELLVESLICRVDLYLKMNHFDLAELLLKGLISILSNSEYIHLKIQCLIKQTDLYQATGCLNKLDLTHTRIKGIIAKSGFNLYKHVKNL